MLDSFKTYILFSSGFFISIDTDSIPLTVPTFQITYLCITAHLSVRTGNDCQWALVVNMKRDLRQRETRSKTIIEQRFIFAATERRTTGERFAENSQLKI